MIDAPKSLNALGIEFRTDKSSLAHDYLTFYERYLFGLRDKPVKLLEIGVFNGASLAVWEAYFPYGQIVGADIEPTASRFARERVAIEIIDQSNLEDLVRIGMKHGPFDVIIDDGSHLWEHQITSLRTMFPFVRDGGIYIVEDLHTNYGELADSYRGVATQSCMEYLKQLVDLRVSDPMLDITREEDPFLRTYGHAMHAIIFYRRACLIEKSMRQAMEIASAPPFVPVSQINDPIRIAIFAHVGNFGDRRSTTGAMRPMQPGQHIQGFAVTTPRTEVGLEYRARLAQGAWTDWAPAPAFVGTRGRGQDLTGFAVRLTEAGRAAYEVSAIGAFGLDPEPVMVGDGEDCVPRQGLAPLAGMQIVLRARG